MQQYLINNPRVIVAFVIGMGVLAGMAILVIVVLRQRLDHYRNYDQPSWNCSPFFGKKNR